MNGKTSTYALAPSNETTLSVEVGKTGLLRDKKHYLFFEEFAGEILFDPVDLTRCRAWVRANTASVVCRDKWLKVRDQQRVTAFTKREVLETEKHPQLEFQLSNLTLKPVRGYCAEGTLSMCGTSRTVKVNFVATGLGSDRISLDGDATLSLDSFGLRPAARMWGLAGTKDEALVRFMLFAVALPTARSQTA